MEEPTAQIVQREGTIWSMRADEEQNFGIREQLQSLLRRFQKRHSDLREREADLTTKVLQAESSRSMNAQPEGSSSTASWSWWSTSSRSKRKASENLTMWDMVSFFSSYVRGNSNDKSEAGRRPWTVPMIRPSNDSDGRSVPSTTVNLADDAEREEDSVGEDPDKSLNAAEEDLRTKIHEIVMRPGSFKETSSSTMEQDFSPKDMELLCEIQELARESSLRRERVVALQQQLLELSGSRSAPPPNACSRISYLNDEVKAMDRLVNDLKKVLNTMRPKAVGSQGIEDSFCNISSKSMVQNLVSLYQNPLPSAADEVSVPNSVVETKPEGATNEKNRDLEKTPPRDSGDSEKITLSVLNSTRKELERLRGHLEYVCSHYEDTRAEARSLRFELENVKSSLRFMRESSCLSAGSNKRNVAVSTINDNVNEKSFDSTKFVYDPKKFSSGAVNIVKSMEGTSRLRIMKDNKTNETSAKSLKSKRGRDGKKHGSNDLKARPGSHRERKKSPRVSVGREGSGIRTSRKKSEPPAGEGVRGSSAPSAALAAQLAYFLEERGAPRELLERALATALRDVPAGSPATEAKTRLVETLALLAKTARSDEEAAALARLLVRITLTDPGRVPAPLRGVTVAAATVAAPPPSEPVVAESADVAAAIVLETFLGVPLREDLRARVFLQLLDTLSPNFTTIMVRDASVNILINMADEEEDPYVAAELHRAAAEVQQKDPARIGGAISKASPERIRREAQAVLLTVRRGRSLIEKFGKGYCEERHSTRLTTPVAAGEDAKLSREIVQVAYLLRGVSMRDEILRAIFSEVMKQPATPGRTVAEAKERTIEVVARLASWQTEPTLADEVASVLVDVALKEPAAVERLIAQDNAKELHQKSLPASSTNTRPKIRATQSESRRTNSDLEKFVEDIDTEYWPIGFFTIAGSDLPIMPYFRQGNVPSSDVVCWSQEASKATGSCSEEESQSETQSESDAESYISAEDEDILGDEFESNDGGGDINQLTNSRSVQRPESIAGTGHVEGQQRIFSQSSKCKRFNDETDPSTSEYFASDESSAGLYKPSMNINKIMKLRNDQQSTLKSHSNIKDYFDFSCFQGFYHFQKSVTDNEVMVSTNEGEGAVNQQQTEIANDGEQSGPSGAGGGNRQTTGKGPCLESKCNKRKRHNELPKETTCACENPESANKQNQSQNFTSPPQSCPVHSSSPNAAGICEVCEINTCPVVQMRGQGSHQSVSPEAQQITVSAPPEDAECPATNPEFTQTCFPESCPVQQSHQQLGQQSKHSNQPSQHSVARSQRGDGGSQRGDGGSHREDGGSYRGDGGSRRGDGGSQRGDGGSYLNTAEPECPSGRPDFNDICQPQTCPVMLAKSTSANVEQQPSSSAPQPTPSPQRSVGGPQQSRSQQRSFNEQQRTPSRQPSAVGAPASTRGSDYYPECPAGDPNFKDICRPATCPVMLDNQRASAAPSNISRQPSQRIECAPETCSDQSDTVCGRDKCIAKIRDPASNAAGYGQKEECAPDICTNQPSTICREKCVEKAQPGQTGGSAMTPGGDSAMAPGGGSAMGPSPQGSNIAICGQSKCPVKATQTEPQRDTTTVYTQMTEDKPQQTQTQASLATQTPSEHQTTINYDQSECPASRADFDDLCKPETCPVMQMTADPSRATQNPSTAQSETQGGGDMRGTISTAPTTMPPQQSSASVLQRPEYCSPTGCPVQAGGEGEECRLKECTSTEMSTTGSQGKSAATQTQSTAPSTQPSAAAKPSQGAPTGKQPFECDICSVVGSEQISQAPAASSQAPVDNTTSMAPPTSRTPTPSVTDAPQSQPQHGCRPQTCPFRKGPQSQHSVAPTAPSQHSAAPAAPSQHSVTPAEPSHHSVQPSTTGEQKSPSVMVHSPSQTTGVQTNAADVCGPDTCTATDSKCHLPNCDVSQTSAASRAPSVKKSPSAAPSTQPSVASKASKAAPTGKEPCDCDKCSIAGSEKYTQTAEESPSSHPPAEATISTAPPTSHAPTPSMTQTQVTQQSCGPHTCPYMKSSQPSHQSVAPAAPSHHSVAPAEPSHHSVAPAAPSHHSVAPSGSTGVQAVECSPEACVTTASMCDLSRCGIPPTRSGSHAPSVKHSAAPSPQPSFTTKGSKAPSATPSRSCAGEMPATISTAPTSQPPQAEASTHSATPSRSCAGEMPATISTAPTSQPPQAEASTHSGMQEGPCGPNECPALQGTISTAQRTSHEPVPSSGSIMETCERGTCPFMENVGKSPAPSMRGDASGADANRVPSVAVSCADGKPPSKQPSTVSRASKQPSTAPQKQPSVTPSRQPSSTPQDAPTGPCECYTDQGEQQQATQPPIEAPTQFRDNVSEMEIKNQNYGAAEKSPTETFDIPGLCGDSMCKGVILAREYFASLNTNASPSAMKTSKSPSPSHASTRPGGRKSPNECTGDNEHGDCPCTEGCPHEWLKLVEPMQQRADDVMTMLQELMYKRKIASQLQLLKDEGVSPSMPQDGVGVTSRPYQPSETEVNMQVPEMQLGKMGLYMGYDNAAMYADTMICMDNCGNTGRRAPSRAPSDVKPSSCPSKSQSQQHPSRSPSSQQPPAMSVQPPSRSPSCQQPPASEQPPSRSPSCQQPPTMSVQPPSPSPSSQQPPTTSVQPPSRSMSKQSQTHSMSAKPQQSSTSGQLPARSVSKQSQTQSVSAQPQPQSPRPSGHTGAGGMEDDPCYIEKGEPCKRPEVCAPPCPPRPKVSGLKSSSAPIQPGGDASARSSAPQLQPADGGRPTRCAKCKIRLAAGSDDTEREGASFRLLWIRALMCNQEVVHRPLRKQWMSRKCGLSPMHLEHLDNADDCQARNDPMSGKFSFRLAGGCDRPENNVCPCSNSMCSNKQPIPAKMGQSKQEPNNTSECRKQPETKEMRKDETSTAKTPSIEINNEVTSSENRFEVKILDVHEETLEVVEGGSTHAIGVVTLRSETVAGVEAEGKEPNISVKVEEDEFIIAEGKNKREEKLAGKPQPGKPRPSIVEKELSPKADEGFGRVKNLDIHIESIATVEDGVTTVVAEGTAEKTEARIAEDEKGFPIITGEAAMAEATVKGVSDGDNAYVEAETHWKGTQETMHMEPADVSETPALLTPTVRDTEGVTVLVKNVDEEGVSDMAVTTWVDVQSEVKQGPHEGLAEVKITTQEYVTEEMKVTTRDDIGLILHTVSKTSMEETVVKYEVSDQDKADKVEDLQAVAEPTIEVTKITIETGSKQRLIGGDKPSTTSLNKGVKEKQNISVSDKAQEVEPQYVSKHCKCQAQVKQTNISASDKAQALEPQHVTKRCKCQAQVKEATPNIVSKEVKCRSGNSDVDTDKTFKSQIDSKKCTCNAKRKEDN